MSRFRNTETDVVVSVDDSKDDRYNSDLWESADAAPKKAPAKKSASSKSSK